jgi:hypothetical protein
MDDAKKERIINLAAFQGNRFIKDLLREKNLTIGNTEKEFRINIRKAFDENKLSEEDIEEWLNKVEGWGDQQAFIYIPILTKKEIARYGDISNFTTLAKKVNKEKLINRSHINLLPEKKELTLIQHTPQLIRFVWHESIDWKRRLESKDYNVYDKDLESKVYYQAYHEQWGRGVSSFAWRLDLNYALVSIPRRASSTDYESQRDHIINSVQEIIGSVSKWYLVNISKAIFALDDKANKEKPKGSKGRKIRTTKTDFEANGGIVAIQSTHKDLALQDNILLQSVRKEISLKKGFSGKQGDFYISSDSKDQELHAVLYGNQNRISLPRQMSDDVVWNFITQIVDLVK